jgi:DNA-binding HxlR family transcriptional regulator
MDHMASNGSSDGGGPAPPRKFDEHEIERIVEFLSSKGGMILIAELQDGPKRFIELRDTFGISGSTIKDRLDDAKDLGLVPSEESVYTGDGHKVHPLTPKGQVIADELQVTDLARIQREIWRLEAEFDDELEAFADTLHQKTTDLNDALQTLARESF